MIAVSDLQNREARFTILVVEDNVDSLMAISRLLRADGHTVHTADGYQAALDVARRERVDLAVCDIALWDGNGCDLLRDLQKLQAMKAIAVTGFALSDEVVQYRSAGFAAVLPKPLRHSQLTSAIYQLASVQANEPLTNQTDLDHLSNDSGRSGD
jgi:two-component system cell cycle response regulator